MIIRIILKPKPIICRSLLILLKNSRSGFLIINHRDNSGARLIKACSARVATYDVADEGYSGETVNYLAHDIKIKMLAKYLK